MNTNERYQLGMAAYNAGRYAEAIGRLEPLLAEQGVTGLLSRFYLGQAHHQVALEYFRQMAYRQAASHFELAAQLNPLGGGVERFLAACYVKSGRFDLAVDQLRSVLAAEPDDAETRIRLALALWKKGDRAEAADILREGLACRRPTAELAYQLGVMLAAQDELSQAEKLFERAIGMDSRHVGAYERLAQCCGVRGDVERSRELLQRACSLDPANSRIAFQLAVLAREPGAGGPCEIADVRQRPSIVMDEAAIDHLGEVVTGEPEFVRAFLSLPASDVDREVFSILAITLERALEKHPEYADLHYHCGAVYRRLGLNAAAIQHAERAVDLNPKFINALILLGELYSLTERWADSVQRLQEAIDEGGDYADVHYMLGRLYQSKGQLSRAHGAFERALVLNRRYQPAKDALISLQAANR